MRVWAIILLCCSIGFGLQAQETGGFAFGVKGGFSLGTQQWDNFERSPLFASHGIAFIESLSDNNKAGIFAQAGFHVRGSAIRGSFAQNVNTGRFNQVPAQEFRFNNVALSVGAKQKYPILNNARAYYLFGIRGEYTVNTNLSEYEDFILATGNLFFPIEGFVRKLNYGAILGGGFEFPFARLMSGVLEISISPDFSQQYRQPAIPNVLNPFTNAPQTISERMIRNTSFEISLGIRLIREVEYLD